MRFLPTRSSLCNHIGHVVSLRSCTEVGRVAANPIVAGVQDNHAIRDWAVSCLKRQMVSVVGSVVSCCPSVSPNCDWASPRPTRNIASGLVDPIKYRRGIVLLCNVVTGAGAVLRVSAWRSLEGFPALMANVFSLRTILFDLLMESCQSTFMGAVFRCRGLVRPHGKGASTDVASERYWHVGLHSGERLNSLNYTLSVSQLGIQIHPNGQLALAPVLAGDN